MSEETLYLGMSMKVWIAVVAVLLLVAAVVAVVLATPAGKSLVAPGPGPAPSTGFPLPTEPAGPVGPSPAPVSGAVIPPVVVVQPPAPAPAPAGLIEQAQGMGAGIIAAIVVAALVLAIFLFMGGKKVAGRARGASAVKAERTSKNMQGELTVEQRQSLIKVARVGSLSKRDINSIKQSYNQLNLNDVQGKLPNNIFTRPTLSDDDKTVIDAIYIMEQLDFNGIVKLQYYKDQKVQAEKSLNNVYKALLKNGDWKQQVKNFFISVANKFNWKESILKVLAYANVRELSFVEACEQIEEQYLKYKTSEKTPMFSGFREKLASFRKPKEDSANESVHESEDDDD